MLRTALATTALLLAADVGTTATADATGVSLTAAAEAADFSGRIRRIRMKERIDSTDYKAQVVVDSDGDASAEQAASIDLAVCAASGCTEGDGHVAVPQGSFSAYYRTGLIPWTGGTAPTGTHAVYTELVNGDGKRVGETQDWDLVGDGKRIHLKPVSDVTMAPYITDLEAEADACGNGRLQAAVSGESKVAGVRIVSLSGGHLFDKADAEVCDGYPCHTAAIDGGEASFTDARVEAASLGESFQKLATLEKAPVLVVVTARSADGKVIGTRKIETTAHYGEILIDGVPLAFD